MPRAHKGLPFVKRCVRRGKVYLYFKTGAKSAKGQPILKRLPDPTDPSFGAIYGAYCGARTKRADIGPELTVAELIRRYEYSPDFRKLSDGTQTTYGIYLRQIEREFEGAPAADVTVEDVYSLVNKMAERPQAANMMVTVMRNVYKFGRSPKRKLVTIDPTFEIEQTDGGEYEPWPDELLAAALASDDPLIRNPVALLYFTAQRIGDVCAIHWNDIKDGHIALTQQKTGKELDVPVHSDLQAILDGIPKRGMTILADEKGRAARVATVRGRLQKWALDNHKLKIVPHGLRKNAVNALLEAGCSVGETSSISGQSLGMVEHYAKRRKNRKMAGAAILKWEQNK
jgi:integrase